jgi:DNA-binding transcriptional regulator YiaG
MSPKRIKALRKKLGLTQSGLAEQIGCFQVTVARWETGENEPRGANLKMLLMLEREASKKQKGGKHGSKAKTS